MKLQSQFGLWVSALLGVTIFSLSGTVIVSEARHLKSEIEDHNRNETQQLAQVCQEALYGNELIFVNYVRALRNNEAFRDAAYVDASGKIQFHSSATEVGNTYTTPSAYQRLIDMTAPVSFAGRQAGYAHLLLDRASIEKSILQATRQTIERIGFLSLLVFIVGTAGAFFVARQLIKPIRAVADGMKRVAGGHREPLVFTRRGDELGEMGEEVNRTIVKLGEVEELKRNFVSSVTHELRSPLTAIQTFMNRALQDEYGIVRGPLRESLLVVQNNTERLRTFVDDLLLVSKIESKKMTVYWENFDVRWLVNDVFKLYEPLAQEKKLQYERYLPSTSIVVHAERDKVFKILSNLVSNAFKFTSQGGIALEAKSDRGAVMISVRDTGSGVPAGEREKIFERFFRSNSNANNAPGTGLGLAIAYELATAMGGALKHEPNTSGGSIFTVRLKPATDQKTAG